MKSEVFAEDIEALLVRLDGVAGARVVATDAGEIDRIFVTASVTSDPPSLRRAIAAALMSEFALPIALWRIHVARLRTDDRRLPPPTLHRLAETVEGTTAKIVVELETADAHGRLTGSAKGSADAQTRLRLAAEATLQALRPLLPTEERKVVVEDITTVRLAEGVAVVVALAGLTEPGSLVGTAPVVDAGEAEAGVAATLDAIAKRNARSDEAEASGMKSRREDFEAPRSEDRRPRAPDGPADASANPQAGSGPAADDTTSGLAEIRPERPGGAAELRTDRAPAPRRVMEDEYFRHLIDGRVPVDIACRDGYQIHRGIIVDFGTYSLMVQTSGGRELLYKHAIVSVRETDTPGDR